jgi:hypothetical protein
MDELDLSRWHGKLLSGEARAIRVLPTPVERAADPRSPAVLFPGAFNPLHGGHRAMAEFAEAQLGRPVEFEISLVNVDKPPLAVLELVRRCEQFTPEQSLWLTSAPRFAEKAECFPGATFVVGIDTVGRLIDPRYYAGDAVACQRAIEHIAARGCRFLVFGRALADGFATLSQLDLPQALAAICDEVRETEFRADVSSTEIRIAGRG